MKYLTGESMKLFWREQIERWSMDTLKQRIRNKLGGYTVGINYITIDNPLFRGVVWNERPTTIDQLSYPYIVSQNRVE